MNKHIGRAALVLAASLSLVGCSDKKSPVEPVDDCPFSLSVTPLSGAPGFYVVKAVPAGPFDCYVNATGTAVEFEAIVNAPAGTVIQGCRPCGCSPSVTLR